MVVIKPIVENTKMSINGKRVVKLVYPKNEKNPYTKNQIGTLIQKYQNNLKKGNIKMMVSIDIPKIGFRSGKSFSKDEDIEMPDTYDWDTAKQFVLYYYSENK
jgi:hypothetical protein